jgi:hypothetical protein
MLVSENGPGYLVHAFEGYLGMLALCRFQLLPKYSRLRGLAQLFLWLPRQQKVPCPNQRATQISDFP